MRPRLELGQEGSVGAVRPGPWFSCLPHPDTLAPRTRHCDCGAQPGAAEWPLTAASVGRRVCVPAPASHTPTACPGPEAEATLFPGIRPALPRGTHLGRPSVLVQDEGHLGAVHAGRQPLARAHVEHGQGGERPGHVPAGCHLPQLLCVPADAAVVHHLDAGGAGPAESSALGIHPRAWGPAWHCL